MSAGFVLRLADLRDVTAFADHLIRQLSESGRNGAPVFAPGHRSSREEMRDNTEARWARRLTDPTWARAWVMETEDRRIVGHAELRGGRISTEMHRATLGMGIEQAFTGRGHGKRLLDAVIGWARSETPVVWIDLGVFTNNAPAIKLYERSGFTRQMIKSDAFRLEDGTSIDDISMTLRIR